MDQAIADALQHRWATTTSPTAPANHPQSCNLDDPDLAAQPSPME
jgi:hypothetical protein